MIIEYDMLHGNSGLYSSNVTYCSKSKDLKFNKIRVGKASPHWRMHFTHEIGHALHHYYISKPKPRLPKDRTKMQLFRQELIAWRIAKAMTKPRYWNEQEAIECLQTYAPYHWTFINWDKLKIIPFK